MGTVGERHGRIARVAGHGWAAFAAVRYPVVLFVFALVRSAAGLGGPWPGWTEGNGRLIAALLWFNALRDGFVIATGVVPTFVLLRWLGVV